MTIDARTGRRRPGPAPRISRETIADAVLDLGFDGLTVTAVGKRLGTTHAALYRHVRDRDALVVAAVERLVERHPPAPPAPDWHTALESGAEAYFALLRSHPGLVEALVLTPGAREPLAPYGTGLTRELLRHGFPVELAVLAADSVLDLARDSARTGGRLAAADPAGVRARMAAQWPDDEPVRTLITDALLGDPADWFRKKLRLVIAGVSASAPPS